MTEAQRIAELERQVLVLREALEQSATSMLDSGYRTNSVAVLAAQQALTDTAQAGREAEYRVIHSAMQKALDKLEDEHSCDWCDGYKVALFRVGDAAPRLRNGGSDSE